MELKKYVLGLCFDETYDHVVLVEKNRPDFQKGKLNGVGGQVENGEKFIDTMVREFKEETDAFISDWRPLITIQNSTFKMRCFVTSGSLEDVKTMTDEIIRIIEVDELTKGYFYDLMPEMTWLIPFAVYMDKNRITDSVSNEFLISG